MRQYTRREFIKIVESNGYYYSRSNGSHAIYVNRQGRHITIPRNLLDFIAKRLIKENNLNIDLKNGKHTRGNTI